MKLNVLITITYTSDTPLTYYEIMIIFARPLSVTPNAVLQDLKNVFKRLLICQCNYAIKPAKRV